MSDVKEINKTSTSAQFSGPCMVFRGDWNPYDDYGYQNCVCYRIGFSFGLFIASDYIGRSERCPTLNKKWIKIGSFNQDAIKIIRQTFV